MRSSASGSSLRLTPILGRIVAQGRDEGWPATGEPEHVARVLVSVIQGANEAATELYFARRDDTIPYAEVEPGWPPTGGPWNGSLGLPGWVVHEDRSRDAARVVRLTAGPKGDPMTAIIQTEKLTKSYGEHRGIIDVDLEVDEGEVFGFLGPNGAGKTTTIRTVLDLIRPTSGRALVFGIDSSVDPVAIHRRVGYIPGEFTLYDRLTGRPDDRVLRQPARRRRRRLPGLADRALRSRPSRKFKEYSKGNKQKVGLIIALQHRPELLILDEPTSGLDPLVQQSFYELVREASAEGRTVFLSSHILSEVERTCDRVAIIRDGGLVKVDRVEALRDLAHHQIELRFVDGVPVAAFEGLPGVSEVSVEDHTLRMRVSGPVTPVVRAAAQYELLDFVSREPTLEETFLAQYGQEAVEEARS